MHIEPVKQGDGLKWIVLNDDGTRYVVATSPRVAPDGHFVSSGIVDAFPTEASAKDVMHEAQDYQRFTALREWMQGCGCHHGCAVHLAFNRVEIERGRIEKSAAPPCDFCPSEAPDMNCADLVRGRWKMAPEGRLEQLVKPQKQEAA